VPRPKGSSPSYCASLQKCSHPVALIRPVAEDSDSDEDYGSRSKKKKLRPTDAVRLSSRAARVPNYTDDGAGDLDDELTEEEMDADDANALPLKEEEEIEAVLSHFRDAERKDDAEDMFHENIVRSSRHLSFLLADVILLSATSSNGKTTRTSTTPRRATSS
jgi:hypothetical protein